MFRKGKENVQKNEHPFGLNFSRVMLNERKHSFDKFLDLPSMHKTKGQ